MADALHHERANATFDVTEMTHFIHGGKEKAERRAEIHRIVDSDPVFSKADRHFLERRDLYKRALEKSAHLFKRTRELNLNEEDGWTFFAALDEELPVGLHHVMFMPAIQGQASEEQQAAWLPLAQSYKMIGCYAQTELGHGSNVQGLETTATYDARTEEFVIHSPTLTSTKWWPGGLGKTSTHTILYARLITQGRDFGIHAFLVQLRSLEDHMPLPGITVGDIGTKFGIGPCSTYVNPKPQLAQFGIGAYNTNDNGFLRFEHVRIPRGNMLMKYAQLTRDGAYKPSPNSKLAYGAMVFVRASIVSGAGRSLARAVTIATRYSAVRRQFGGGGGAEETKVLDYPLQQRRLLPLLASAYAFACAGKYMVGVYADLQAQLARRDFTSLPEVHAISSGLKALTTMVTAEGIEECRKLCGGHGYLMCSGIPELFTAYVPACTYEGDNYVLMQQVARYLLKAAAMVAGGKKPRGTAAYMRFALLSRSKCDADSSHDMMDPDVLIAAAQARAAGLTVAAAAELQSRVGGVALKPAASFTVFAGISAPFPSPKGGKDSDGPDGDAPASPSWDLTAPALVRAARAHCELLVMTTFAEAAKAASGSIKPSLEGLCLLYCLTTLEAAAGDLLELGHFAPRHVGMVRGAVTTLLGAVRRDAVPLVDAFDFSDNYLNSALGRKDGQVYQALWDRAQAEPLNQRQVADGIEEHLRPLISGAGAGIQAKL